MEDDDDDDQLVVDIRHTNSENQIYRLRDVMWNMDTFVYKEMSSMDIDVTCDDDIVYVLIHKLHSIKQHLYDYCNYTTKRSALAWMHSGYACILCNEEFVDEQDKTRHYRGEAHLKKLQLNARLFDILREEIRDVKKSLTKTTSKINTQASFIDPLFDTHLSITDCGHLFHSKCIHQLEHRNNRHVPLMCPVCRAKRVVVRKMYASSMDTCPICLMTMDDEDRTAKTNGQPSEC